MLNTTKTVREFAVELPGATRVFEQLGIDYCCGGGRSLAEACAVAGIEIERTLTALAEAGQQTGATVAAAQFQTGTLKELIAHILETHHVFTRQEIARLDALLAKVCGVHGANHPELLRVQALFQELARDLTPHMLKEEQILFPYILRLEEAANGGQPAPRPPFGTVRNPVRMMMLEHDTAGELLRRIRRTSRDFNAPPDACISYQTLYGALAAFEADLHQHIHLENNLLFPRAVELEEMALAG